MAENTYIDIGNQGKCIIRNGCRLPNLQDYMI